MQKIIPNLWFENDPKEAVDFYLSVFKDSKLNYVTHYTEASAKVSGKPAGETMSISFTLNDMEIIAINGGPLFKFSEAVSLMIECEAQEEIDYYWNALTDGGSERPCGWLKDKYGFSWQVSPKILDEMIKNDDSQKADRAFQAMVSMKKLDIAELERAYNG